MIEDYFRDLELLITKMRIVIAANVTYDKRSATIGFVRGELFFLDGSRLHLREYINVEPVIDRYTYSYHYQSASGALIFRYDNTPHYPHLPDFPHHKHVKNETNVINAQPANLAIVLTEVQSIVIQSI